jgi:hypothetical protein
MDDIGSAGDPSVTLPMPSSSSSSSTSLSQFRPRSFSVPSSNSSTASTPLPLARLQAGLPPAKRLHSALRSSPSFLDGHPFSTNLFSSAAANARSGRGFSARSIASSTTLPGPSPNFSEGVTDLSSSGPAFASPASLESDPTRLISSSNSSSTLSSTVTPLGSFVAPSPLDFSGSGSVSGSGSLRNGLGSISSSFSLNSSSSNSTTAYSGTYQDHPAGPNNPNHPSSAVPSSSGDPGSGFSISMPSSLSGSSSTPDFGRFTSGSGRDVPMRPTVVDTPRLRDRSNDDFLNTADGHDPTLFPDKTIIKHMVDTASFIISDFSKQYLDNVSALAKAQSAHKTLSTHLAENRIPKSFLINYSVQLSGS